MLRGGNGGGRSHYCCGGQAVSCSVFRKGMIYYCFILMLFQSSLSGRLRGGFEDAKKPLDMFFTCRVFR